MLMYAGANVRATTRLGAYTPLFLASQAGHADVMDALIKGGADPKAADPAGTTPLMEAAASGHTDAVQVLLDHGVDVNAKESVRGTTAADVRRRGQSRSGHQHCWRSTAPISSRRPRSSIS